MADYKPQIIPLDQVLHHISSLSEDSTFEAAKAISRKNASPKDVRIKKNTADFYHSIKQYLQTLSHTV